MRESTDLGEPSRRELDELLAALRQPPRADELDGETEAVASMVSAFGSPTDDRAPGRQRNRRLHLAAVAAGLVFVVAGAAAAAPHLLKTTDTRSVVPSATSTLAVAQAGGIGPQTTSEEPAGTSSRVGGDTSSPPTTPADATVPEPATTQPDADVVARCVDRGLGASTSSTIHDARRPARPRLRALRRQLCRCADNPPTTANRPLRPPLPVRLRPERTIRIRPSNTAAGAGRPTGAGPGFAVEHRSWPARSACV